MKSVILGLFCLLLTSCNAFTEADDFGPQPGPDPSNNGSVNGETSPNNGATAPNNGVLNNTFANATTNSVDCLAPEACGICVNGSILTCEEIIPGCLVYADDIPCDGVCVDNACQPSPCETECMPSASACEQGALLECITTPQDCSKLKTYECLDGSTCEPAALECILSDFTCDMLGAAFCLNSRELVKCNADFTWVAEPCAAGTYCDPDVRACITFEEL